MIPTRVLASGDKMPGLGLGTFGSDKYSHDQVANAVVEAVAVGYRHIDCASIYGNEKEIGEALSHSSVPRGDLWITSKVWNNMHRRVAESCEQSLADLRLDCLDLYLVHWPFPNHHEKGVSVDSRDPHAVPFSLERYMDTWGQMERLVERGLVRNIGCSNMTTPKLRGLLGACRIRPAACELELHPHFQQNGFLDLLVSEEIAPIGYSPIGSPSRPERDRTPEDTVDIEDPAIVAAADRLGVHPAVVCVLWQVQLGATPIPFSVKRSQFEAIFSAVESMKLTEDEMAAIAEADKGCRLIKGQVFLWPEAADWRDLWDGEA